MRRLAPLLLLAALGAWLAPPGAAAPRPFAYDASAPLGFRDRGVVNRGYPIAVHDVSYVSPRGGRVPAFLVVPPLRGRHPAVIYLHGSGGDRLELLVQATWMAARGAIALCIDLPDARRTAAIQPGLPGVREQVALAEQAVVDVRRAVDVLRARRDVDPHRIALVGWSEGARTGAIVAGVDHRIRAFDLISGGASPIAAYVRGLPAARRAPVARLLSQVDPLRYVRAAAPSALLLQDGLADTVVPRSALRDLASAASEPKRVIWYRAGHWPNANGFRDGLQWLDHELGLRGPVVHGVLSGP
jgi:dienelactone hydrolase